MITKYACVAYTALVFCTKLIINAKYHDTSSNRGSTHSSILLDVWVDLKKDYINYIFQIIDKNIYINKLIK